MKIVTIIGARPQFIKAAAFSNKFRENTNNVEILVHTGQHYDKNMSEIFFEELNIPKPDYNLGIGSGSHGVQTGRMLEKIEEILLKETPDGVLLYGDTNSTIAGALAASKLLIPVFHVEAGLRSYDMTMPEEQNRRLTDHVSTLLFCPTKTAVKNLKSEGIIMGVINSGDVMYDAIISNLEKSEKKYQNGEWLTEINNDKVSKLDLKGKDYYLATVHRPYNTDNVENMKNIFKAFNKLNKPVIMPLHPRTINKIKGLDTTNIYIIDPVGYLLMIYLTKNAYMTITDSGGLQKETYLLKTPGTILRDVTEWVETLENDWNKLSLINVESIIKNVNRNLDCVNSNQKNSFGDGKAADKIIKEIEKYINKES